MSMVIVRFLDGRPPKTITRVVAADVHGAALLIKTEGEDGRMTIWGFALVNVEWEARS